MHNKLFRLAVIFTALLAMHVQAHAFFWSDWKEYEGIKELPFIYGKSIKLKIRSSTCAFCSTGAKSETAIFSNNERERNYGESGKVEKDIAKKSEALFQQAIPKSEWIYLGKNFVGTSRYFYPTRIFVPSIDPLILITTSWSYKAAMQKNFNGHGLTDEVQVFYEWEVGRDDETTPRKRTMVTWGDELFLPFEIRGTLPKEISQIQIISNGFQQSVKLPMQSSDEAVTVDVNQQKMSFSRSENGKTVISFENK
jgi:hypothetical protein